MEKIKKTYIFNESYSLWLKSKHTKHSSKNLELFCQIWNENIIVAENKAINEFYKKLKELKRE